MSLVTLRKLAEELGIDRSHARKYVTKLGITFREIRVAEFGNQKMLAVTEEEAITIRQSRVRDGFVSQSRGDETNVEVGTGVFYVIQLVPELDERRVKLGFTADLQTRLSQHRTAAPTAVVLKSWPCQRAWEPVVVDCASPLCRLIWSEVFEVDDMEAFCRRIDEFFNLMPAPGYVTQLSPYSPLNT